MGLKTNENYCYEYHWHTDQPSLLKGEIQPVTFENGQMYTQKLDKYLGFW